MSRQCLFETQPLDYRFVYVMHFVSGGAMLSAAVLDAIQIPGWTLRRRPLETLYSPIPLSPAYAIVLAVATIAVTLTWTVFVDWEASDVPRLGATLLLVIVVTGALGAAVLRLLAPRDNSVLAGDACSSLSGG